MKIHKALLFCGLFNSVVKFSSFFGLSAAINIFSLTTILLGFKLSWAHLPLSRIFLDVELVTCELSSI